MQAVLTGALGARDKSLARVAHLEDGGCLDVVPLLEGHGVHPAVGQDRTKKSKKDARKAGAGSRRQLATYLGVGAGRDIECSRHQILCVLPVYMRQSSRAFYPRLHPVISIGAARRRVQVVSVSKCTTMRLLDCRQHFNNRLLNHTINCSTTVDIGRYHVHKETTTTTVDSTRICVQSDIRTAVCDRGVNSTDCREHRCLRYHVTNHAGYDTERVCLLCTAVSPAGNGDAGSNCFQFSFVGLTIPHFSGYMVEAHHPLQTTVMGHANMKALIIATLTSSSCCPFARPSCSSCL